MPAKGYWIARVDVLDVQRFKAYAEALPGLVAQFDGRFLVRSGRHEGVEGVARGRNVVIEFPSYEMAMACWNSPDYAAVARLREGIALADVVVVEGVET